VLETILLFAVLGAGTGALYAMASVGLVLTYRGSGVINFASGAMGMTGAFAFYELYGVFHWPVLAAMFVGVCLSASLGLLCHFLMSHLQKASNLTRIVVTLAMLVALQGLLGLKYPATSVYNIVPFLPNSTVRFAGSNLSVSRLILLGIAIGIAVCLAIVYRRTRFGVATTAVSENPLALSTLGWSANSVAAWNWVIGTALSGFAAIMLGPIIGVSLGLTTALLLPSLAAGVIGNFHSFSLTLAGAIGIGIVQSELTRYVSTVNGIGDAVPFAVILVVIVWRGRRVPTRGSITERLPSVTSGVVPVKKVIVGVFALLVVINVLPLQWVGALTTTLIGAIILLSIVVVTGFAGQISLAQWTIGIGAAFVTGWLRVWGLPFWLAIVLGVLSAVPVGILIGTAALRARGISLAIATLAFAVCIVSLLLTNPAVTGYGSGLNTGTFSLFGINLSGVAHPQRFAMFAVLVLVLVGLAVSNSRRGRSGRQMLAVRTNERAASALGINVVAVKLAAFCYGAMVAALGGILSVIEFPVAIFTSGSSGGDIFQNIQLIDFGVLGGVGYVSGPLLGGQGQAGGIATEIFSYLSSNALTYVTLVFGFLSLLVFVQAPNGLAKMQQDLNYKKSTKRRLKKGLAPIPRTKPIELPAEMPVPSAVESAVLEVEGLTVNYGAVRAVDNVSFTLHAGEILGVIGPNGAGKTTLIDALTGFAPLSSGTVRLDGREIGKLGVRQRADLGIGRTFQSLELFEDLSVYENMLAACEKRNFWVWFRDVVHPGKPRLTDAALTAVKDLALEPVLARMPSEITYGMRHLVAIARAIAAKPRVLFLDEPAAGLDERERAEVVEIIRRLAREWNIAVLLIEHDVALVLSVSDRMLALDVGATVAAGLPEEVRSHPAVIASYLGVDEDQVLEGDVPVAEVSLTGGSDDS
jgi:sulfate-transporting ATPase